MNSLELADRLNGVHSGPVVEVRGVAGIQTAGPDDVAFAERQDQESDAGCLLVHAPRMGRSCIVVDDPRAAFAALCLHFRPPRRLEGVHPSAVLEGDIGARLAAGAHVVVEEGAVVGDNVQLHAGVVVMSGAVVGDDSVLFPNVVVHPGTRLGRRCRVGAGSVLGGDGFGYHLGQLLPHVGTLLIGDDVHIGSGCTLDRGQVDATVIGDRCRLDNLVHIAHNVVLGTDCYFAAQVGVAGSSTFGDSVQVGGQAGFVDHITVGNGARVGAQSGVAKPIANGETVLGTPALPIRTTLRIWAKLKQLV